MKEEIAKVAYELYERDGRQNGKDQEHWLAAERIVRARLAERSKAESGRETASRVEKAAPKAAPKQAPAAAKVRQATPKPGAAPAADKGKKTPRTPRSK